MNCEGRAWPRRQTHRRAGKARGSLLTNRCGGSHEYQSRLKDFALALLEIIVAPPKGGGELRRHDNCGTPPEQAMNVYIAEQSHPGSSRAAYLRHKTLFGTQSL